MAGNKGTTYVENALHPGGDLVVVKRSNLDEALKSGNSDGSNRCLSSFAHDSHDVVSLRLWIRGANFRIENRREMTGRFTSVSKFALTNSSALSRAVVPAARTSGLGSSLRIPCTTAVKI